MSSDFFDLTFDSGVRFDSDPVLDTLKALEEKNLPEALGLIEGYKATYGDTVLTKHLLALTMLRMARPVPALKLLREAHDDNPQAFEFAEVLASSLALLGRRTEAVYYAKLSTALQPAYPHYDLVPPWLIEFTSALMMAEENPMVDDAATAIEQGDLTRAFDALTDALTLDGEDRRAWRTLVDVSLMRGRPGEALHAAEALAALSPDDPAALRLLAMASQACGLADTAWAHAQAAVQASNGDADYVHAMIALVRYGEGDGLASLYPNLVEAWHTLAAPTLSKVPVTQRMSAQDRFRVGILSGAIHAGTEKAGFLSTMDECVRRGADLYYYVNQSTEDAVSRRLRRSCERWRAIQAVDDETVAEIIRNDEVQILIDLDGFEPTGRPHVMALAPAPVLIGVGALPGCLPYKADSSNARAWTMIDEAMMAAEVGTGSESGSGSGSGPGARSGSESGALEAKGAAVVSAGLSTWPLFLAAEEESNADGAEQGPLRVLVDGPLSRLSTSFLTVFAQALAAGADMRITLRGDCLEDTIAADLFAQRCDSAGLDASALCRIGPDSDLSAELRDADILLDTFPAPSLNAVFQALRQARPVLCLRPSLPMNGASASLVQGIGLRDWISETAEDLTARLVTLAKNPTSARDSRCVIAQAVARGGGVQIRSDRASALLQAFDHFLAKAAS